MKTPALAELSVDDLVRLYVEICLRQDNAILMGESSRFNREFKRMISIRAELKSRPGDDRRALVPLFDHPNAQVRLMSAIAALAVAPDAARGTLQLISDRNEYPQAADARGILSSLDEGRYVPS